MYKTLLEYCSLLMNLKGAINGVYDANLHLILELALRETR